MTTIVIKKSAYNTQDVIVNGRFARCAQRIETIKKTGNGRFDGIANGEKFSIVGGRESGGAANEWFLHWPFAYGDNYIPANSAKSCIAMIENV